MCATCHGYVVQDAAGRLPPREESESDTLELVAGNVWPKSRLACQIQVTDDLDGIVLQVAER